MRLRLDRIGWCAGKDAQLISFRDECGTTFNIRISSRGRLISVGHGHRTLHSRGQRGPGGRTFRLPSAKAKQAHGMALAAAASKAFGCRIEDFPVQEFDL